VPPLLSSASRLILFALPALWLSRNAGVRHQTCLVLVGWVAAAPSLHEFVAATSRATEEIKIRRWRGLRTGERDRVVRNSVLAFGGLRTSFLASVFQP
jgi:hypothetical protein